MGQSLVSNYMHIVFSTKHRKKLIHPPLEQELHNYIGGICNSLDSPVLIVGGCSDHIHILCMVSKKIALMTLIQKIKTKSSKWVKIKSPNLENFFWQEGYGAFSINNSQIDILKQYIKDQRQHHVKHTFEEEYRDLLKSHKIEFNEKYLWD